MIGKRIKKLRTDGNITQETLASHLNITPQAVSKWEQELALPDISLLVPIADFFGVTTDYLLREASKAQKIDSSFFEIAKEGGLIGSRSYRASYKIKNISSNFFSEVKIKYIFKDETGKMIDYWTDFIFDLDPGFTRNSVARTSATTKPHSIEVEIIDYTLA